MDDMLVGVVSDTSDRTHPGQKPSLARRFIGVSDSTITLFSWLLIEIDTTKRVSRGIFAGGRCAQEVWINSRTGLKNPAPTTKKL